MRHIGFAFLGVGLALLLGCHAKSGRVLGKEPQGEARTAALVQGGESPAKVTLTGELVEKCPTAGCWFRLKDDTGIIKVDTKAAGFVVVNVPLGARVTVGGKVAWDGEETIVQATGLRY
ncbi:MAG: hypothetical protein HZA90_20165 [Verrucomicrobia bacterium]|nr:hypothetical protein [Verrucomicrobiota bacterium]